MFSAHSRVKQSQRARGAEPESEGADWSGGWVGASGPAAVTKAQAGDGLQNTGDAAFFVGVLDYGGRERENSCISQEHYSPHQ